jgi:RecB family exonuclease
MSRYADGVHRYSNTEISTWRDCRRKWMLTYYLGLRKKERDVRYPTAVGNLVHGAFETFYLAGGLDNPNAPTLAREYLVDQRATDLADCASEHHETIVKAHKTADACFTSYLHWLDETGADLDLRIIGSEDKLTMDGPVEGTEINGRIDLLAEDTRTGDIVVIDLKLVSSISDKIRMLHLDTQSKQYALLARHKYERPVRVAFRIVKMNQRSAKTKGVQEEQYEIVLNNGQIETYMRQLEGITSDIIAVTERLDRGEHHQLVAYPSPSDSCSWKCPFFAVCPMLDDPASDAEWLLNDAFEQRQDSVANLETDGMVPESTEDQGGRQ